MVGYLNGGTPTARPLQDLIGTLPATLLANQLSTQYRAFGTRISPPLAEADQGALMTRAYYSCARPGAPDCDNSETRLDNVFQQIAGDKSNLSLVISDLWFSNSDVQTSALSALAEPLAQILASGRAVAVYGVSAPFDGHIYDLPYTTAPLAFKGQHPLFLIAIGSDAQVADFHEELKRSPSPYLHEGLASGNIKRTLYTLSPALKSEAAKQPLTVGADPRIVVQPVLEAHENLEIQQFVLDSDMALRKVKGAVPPRWTGPSTQAFSADAVWQGRYEPRVRVWERRNTSCTDSDWIEGRPIAGLWSAGSSGTQTFTLDPEKLGAELRREGTYLLAAELHRTEVESPNPASQWLRQWGYSPADQNPVRQAADGSPLFPTLHLGEVARLLENALAEAAGRRPSPIFGFAVVVKVER